MSLPLCIPPGVFGVCVLVFCFPFLFPCSSPCVSLDIHPVYHVYHVPQPVMFLLSSLSLSRAPSCSLASSFVCFSSTFPPLKLVSVLCSIVFCFIVTVLNSMFGVFSSASSVSLCLICLSCVPRLFPVSSSFLVYPSVQCHNLPHGCVFLHVPLCMFSFL